MWDMARPLKRGGNEKCGRYKKGCCSDPPVVPGSGNEVLCKEKLSQN